ncbi:MAG: hypothetical protein A2782_02245 [Candidatus Blackburnbacteria bacterium RIFCSPHIGHO2_01_FULL_43_15b]|uniref:Uncharacterized protein n=1 Tax=Candidatus Blackburnbacteria bacterium RIFCSPHIGHO2_01_FULL_43_15b TaxID=1797513 RepID=A0A1G1V0D1_9BACT|nr:MAG: hypothetical protein A2782_02245 [Candidatus Blackburnbacteria bacterium RIFCSPHIGHO2_01_FULL_43_15b]
MFTKKDFSKLLEKIEDSKKRGGYDLSTDEDLSLAVANLISLEEHFFFTAEKTGKKEYLEMLNQTRELRKELLGKLVGNHEGETWCISKHLLAATIRLVEVGTKLQTAKNQKEAEEMFDRAYKVYSLFWALKLKLLANGKSVKEAVKDEVWTTQDLVAKLVDCCKE